LCRSGSEVCNATKLSEVSCAAGYEVKGGDCAAKEVHKTNLMLIIMGLGDFVLCPKNAAPALYSLTGIGAVLALCVIMLLVLIRKHPSRAKKIFLSFMRKSVKKMMRV